MADNFGHIAQSYDSTFTNTRTGHYQRNRVWKYLSSDLPKGSSKILELNCGTGEDAVHLLSLGHTVTATDLSLKMVEVTRHKLKPFNNGNAQVLDLNNLNDLDVRFEYVFSNFGGLNCLSPGQVQNFSKTLNSRLESNGRFTAVIMGRKCWWERFYFGLKKDKTSKNRRLSKSAVLANVEGVDVPTWYYSPKEFVQLMEPEFKLINKRSIGLFVPPSYLDKAFENKRILLKVLYFFEKLSCGAPFLANRADHFYLTFEKR